MSEEYDILAETLDISDPTERDKFLTGRCGADTDLFRKVNALLAQALEEESRFGKYIVEKEIGAGGMGKVYLVSFKEEYEISDVRKTFSKKVALKTINPGQKLDSANIRMFLNEIRTMSDLNHPNIARFYDTGTSEKGLPFFTMEYIEGMPLSKYCKEKRLTVKERLSLFRQVLDAIDYLHSKGLLHCDIKPQNVVVDLQGIPKVIDFGIASKYGAYISDGNTQTAFMQNALTLNYASPEQLKGEKDLTPATDIYSLGVVLYELLTEQLPVKYDKSSSYFQLIEILEKEEPTALGRAVSAVVTQPIENTDEIWQARNCNSLTELKEQLSDELNEIVQTAISKKAKDRYATVKEFNEHIKEYLEVAETSFLDTFKKTAGLLFKKTSRRIKKVPRNLKIASFIILLLAVVALTQIKFIQTLPFYFQNSSAPLLAVEKHQELSEAVLKLKTQITPHFDKAIKEMGSDKTQKIGYNEWGTAQMIVALSDADFKVDANEINGIFDGKQDPKECWQEEISKPCNLAISGWVFLAKRRLSRKITNKQLEFVLERQSTEGWWAVFPAQSDQRNASVYATALVLWGLSEHLLANSIDEDKKAQVISALDKGTTWLLRVRKINDSENFQWVDYPFQDKSKKFHGLDGIVIHVLHVIAKLPQFAEASDLKNNLKEIDDRWLNHLQQNSVNLDPTFEQRSFSYVYTDKGIVYDTTGQYSLPWSLVATVDLYENAGAWQKAVAKKWMDGFAQTNQEGIIILTEKNADKYWVTSEYLFALRYLLGGFNQQEIR